MRQNVLILGHNDATQFIDIYNQYTRIFDPAKYQVTVAYLSGQPSEATKQRTLAEEVLFIETPKKSLRGLKLFAIRKLYGLTREKKFSIVVCHRYKPTYVMLWVAQFCKIPHLFFVMHELGTLRAKTRRLLIACLARKNMVFAGVSNAVTADLKKSLPKQRTATLYNAIDIEQSEPQLFTRAAARKQLNLHEDDFVFGNIARLAINKDHANLLHAFSLIKATCPKAKLIILGEGELETNLKNQAKSYGLEESIIFTGFVPNAYRYMQAFDCFVLSSIQEAFGRVLLEAMIAHCPIIATQVNGIPEVLADTNILLPPNNSQLLADKMQSFYFLSPEERAQQAKRAYHHVQTNFSIPAFHQQFWHLITEA